MDSNSLFNPIQGEVSPARHLARIKKNTSPLILPLNRGNDASAAIQCETIKISQSSLGTPCHKFQQILIILSAVTRPRTFPTEFHPIAAQLHVHRPARARNPEKLLSSSLKPTTRCVVVCCFRFVRPLLSDQTVGHYPPTVRLAFTDPLQCHSFPPRVHESVDPLFVNVAALLLLLLRPGRDNHPVIGPLLFLDDTRARVWRFFWARKDWGGHFGPFWVSGCDFTWMWFDYSRMTKKMMEEKGARRGWRFVGSRWYLRDKIRNDYIKQMK